MDYEDPENKSCLREEPVYCDTMHSCVQNYKNITAWVKNPITRAVMRIATMEAMNEDTPTMTLFFTLLNEVLQKVSSAMDVVSHSNMIKWLYLEIFYSQERQGGSGLMEQVARLGTKLQQMHSSVHGTWLA